MPSREYSPKYVYSTAEVSRILTSLAKRAGDLEEVAKHLAANGTDDDAACGILFGLIDAIAAEGQLTRTAFEHSPI